MDSLSNDPHPDTIVRQNSIQLVNIENETMNLYSKYFYVVFFLMVLSIVSMSDIYYRDSGFVNQLLVLLVLCLGFTFKNLYDTRVATLSIERKKKLMGVLEFTSLAAMLLLLLIITLKLIKLPNTIAAVPYFIHILLTIKFRHLYNTRLIPLIKTGFRILFWIQSLLCFLKLDEILNSDWRAVFSLTILLSITALFYFIFVVASACHLFMSSPESEDEREELIILVLFSCALFYIGGMGLLLPLSLVERSTSQNAGTWKLTVFFSTGMSVFLFGFILNYKKKIYRMLYRLLLDIHNLQNAQEENHQNQPVQLKKKPITRTVEKKGLFFESLSTSYFKPLRPEELLRKLISVSTPQQEKGAGDGKKENSLKRSNSFELKIQPPVKIVRGKKSSTAKATVGSNGEYTMSTKPKPKDSDCLLIVEEKPEMCQICYERPPECVLMKCGHGGFCLVCAEALLESNGKCFYCRQEIESVFEVQPAAKPVSSGKLLKVKSRIQIEA